MRILVAPNSLKESLSAEDAGQQILRGIRLFASSRPSVSIEAKLKPICDGGTGFTRIITDAMNGQLVSVSSYDPKYRRIDALYGTTDRNTAIIEVAQVAGLALLEQHDRNPLYTSSYGVGHMIRHAWESGFRNILVGCGDTAINDYGIGMLSAMGVQFQDTSGHVIRQPLAKDISRIDSQDYSHSICQQVRDSCQITVACNLTSMLKGSLSSSRVYAMQKGASREEADILEACAETFLRLADDSSGLLGYLPGAGGAGGLAGALHSYLGAHLKYSFEVVFETLGFVEWLKWADLVITSEGLFDDNSAKGKAPVAVTLFAKRFSCLTALLAGCIETGASSKVRRSGLDWIEPLSSSHVDMSHYIENAGLLLEDATMRLLSKILPMERVRA